MKTTLPIFLILALTTAGAHRTQAGDREWATAGKVLTGVVAGTLLARALDPGPRIYLAPACAPPVYTTTTVVWQPAPVVVTHHPIPPVMIVPPAPTIASYPPPVVMVPYPAYPPHPVVLRPAPVFVQRVPVHVVRPAVSVHFRFGGHQHHGYGHGHGHR